LRKYSVAGGAEIAMRIADKLQSAVRMPWAKSSGIGMFTGFPLESVRRYYPATEGDLAIECQIIKPIQLYIADIAPKLERVTGGRMR